MGVLRLSAGDTYEERADEDRLSVRGWDAAAAIRPSLISDLI